MSLSSGVNDLAARAAAEFRAVRSETTTALVGKASTTHHASHATGGSDALAPADIGAATANHTHAATAPRTASAAATYSADGTAPGDIQLTCTGNTVITPTGTPNGRMMLVEALASGAQRTPSMATSVLLPSSGGPTSRTLTVPPGSIGLFGLRYSALRAGWILVSAAVI